MAEPIRRGIHITSRVLSCALLGLFVWVSIGLMRDTASGQYNDRDRQQARDLQQTADIANMRDRIVKLESVAEVNREKISALQQSVSNYAGIGTGISLTLMVLQALPLIIRNRARE